MIRWGIRLVLLAAPLFVAGFSGASSWWFEAARLAGAACLAAGVLLLLVDHLWAGGSDTMPPSPPVLGGRGVGGEGGQRVAEDPLSPDPSPPSTAARGTGAG